MRQSLWGHGRNILLNSDPWDALGLELYDLFGVYVDPHFPNIKCFEVYDGIWRYIKVFGGIWKYMKVYKSIWRYMKVYRIYWKKSLYRSPPFRLSSSTLSPAPLLALQGVWRVAGPQGARGLKGAAPPGAEECARSVRNKHFFFVRASPELSKQAYICIMWL